MYIFVGTLKFVDYPLSGYRHRYETITYIIFIQHNGHEYHTIQSHGYPFTSLGVNFNQLKNISFKLIYK